ncbi:MAG: hypothetical protein LBS84_02945 [Clostridiales bacterium]|jgi:hypothetical protein|nr:hypothetical protein [Clostridiales bacterium]
MAAAFSGLSEADGSLIKRFQSLAEYAAIAWRETLNGLAAEAAEAANGMGLDEDETRRMFESFVALGVMTQSAAAAQTARYLLNQEKTAGRLD